MKFCENSSSGLLKQILSSKDIHGNTGLSYLESKGYYYTTSCKEADFFIAICGKILPRFVLHRTIVILTEPESRYPKQYSREYRKLFGGFLGISSSRVDQEEEFYFCPQDFSLVQPLQEKPEYTLVMVHQRYKTEYRNLEGDSERERAVEFFDRMFGENFHTYGRVWRQTLPWPNAGWKGTIKGSFMGDEKLLTIRNYRFLLCFENSREDRYISEKIFAGFLAGAIPIYFGAGDVSKYIPKDCYIEFDGKDYDALYRQMSEMSDEEFQRIRKNGREFIFSSQCEQFTSIALAKKLEKHFINLEKSPSSSISPAEIWKKIRFLQFKYMENN